MRVETLTAKILSLMPKIRKSQSKFLRHIFVLIIACRGKMNFENLARQGIYNESTYRNNFDKDFDFLEFNRLLIENSCEKEVIIAFDPSFISKSGKSTPGVGYYWSGVAGCAKIGLEIGGFGAVDIMNNNCMHLLAKQTVNHKKYDSLIDYYVNVVLSISKELRKVSSFIVADAYFSKKSFVTPVAEAGFTVISRLRKDAALFYRYLGPRRKGKGRPKTFAGRVDVKNPDEQHFRPIIKEPDWTAYQGVVYSRSLKRWIKVVLVHNFKKCGTLKNVQIYFSTDTSMAGSDVLVYYKARYQIEFLYRDAKQFTGLEHCQSRKEKRLDFHFNAALTAVSLAKAAYHLSIPIEQRKAFSMFSIKAQYFNELFLERIFSTFGFEPKIELNQHKYSSLRDFGKIAA